MRPSVAIILFVFVCTACTQRSTLQDAWPYGVKYEVFVLSFADGDGDGKGDLKGLTQKLDYIQQLGVNGLWLMPIMPSPSYHKYDVADYRNIHPDYGTLDDFREFTEEAHKRGIHVIIDLVLNHTATNHPWFQRAVSDVNSPYRNYYLWANKDSIRDQISKKEVTLDSDNILQWHEVNGDSTAEHYYGFFSGRMPDLNFDNRKVRDEMVEIARFWIEEMKVDGFRFDAARHLYPNDQANNCHQFWNWYREQLVKIKPDIYMVGEVYSTDRNEVSPYAKGLPALFNFDLGSRIITTLNAGKDSLDLIENYTAQMDFFTSANAEFLDAPILTNHDQNRIMSQLGNHTGKARTAASILLTLPGTPYVYYGEELGMRGTKPDEFIREPFLWGDEQVRPNWMSAKFSVPDSIANVTMQTDDKSSLMNHYKKLIAYRNSSKPLTFGSINTITGLPPAIIGFTRTFETKTEVVFHNISGRTTMFSVSPDFKIIKNVSFTSDKGVTLNENQLTLPAYATVILTQ
jgi:alpha-amylase